jgi:hypothetical protein
VQRHCGQVVEGDVKVVRHTGADVERDTEESDRCELEEERQVAVLHPKRIPVVKTDHARVNLEPEVSLDVLAERRNDAGVKVLLHFELERVNQHGRILLVLDLLEHRHGVLHACEEVVNPVRLDRVLVEVREVDGRKLAVPVEEVAVACALHRRRKRVDRLELPEVVVEPACDTVTK